jgi:hypothetical protein
MMFIKSILALSLAALALAAPSAEPRQLNGTSYLLRICFHRTQIHAAVLSDVVTGLDDVVDGVAASLTG